MYEYRQYSRAVYNRYVIFSLKETITDGIHQKMSLQYYYLVCIENHLFIVGVGPNLNKELSFIYLSDRSDRSCA